VVHAFLLGSFNPFKLPCRFCGKLHSRSGYFFLLSLPSFLPLNHRRAFARLSIPYFEGFPFLRVTHGRSLHLSAFFQMIPFVEATLPWFLSCLVLLFFVDRVPLVNVHLFPRGYYHPVMVLLFFCFFIGVQESSLSGVMNCTISFFYFFFPRSRERDFGFYPSHLPCFPVVTSLISFSPLDERQSSPLLVELWCSLFPFSLFFQARLL